MQDKAYVVTISFGGQAEQDIFVYAESEVAAQHLVLLQMQKTVTVQNTREATDYERDNFL